jgi:hypothetical protein
MLTAYFGPKCGVVPVVVVLRSHECTVVFMCVGVLCISVCCNMLTEHAMFGCASCVTDH